MLEKLGVPERMNVLLVHEEVLSLLEGDDGTTLMTQYKEGAQQEGWMLKSTEELYDWFFKRHDNSCCLEILLNLPPVVLTHEELTWAFQIFEMSAVGDILVIGDTENPNRSLRFVTKQGWLSFSRVRFFRFFFKHS